jgi:hypothetical protein
MNIIKNRVVHDITYQMNALSNPFSGKIVHCCLGGAKEQIRAVISQNPVVLFRHLPVKGT